MSQELSSAAVVIGALRVGILLYHRMCYLTKVCSKNNL